MQQELESFQKREVTARSVGNPVVRSEGTVRFPEYLETMNILILLGEEEQLHHVGKWPPSGRHDH
jgi:hypothetical protein